MLDVTRHFPGGKYFSALLTLLDVSLGRILAHEFPHARFYCE